MSNTPFNTDDPRLTAYVLGELSDTECAAVEAQLAGCAESRRVVADLRDTTARLFEALQDEPAPALTSTQRQAIHAAAMNMKPMPARPTATTSPPTAHRSEASRRRAVTALVAVVTVSAVVVMALVAPFDADQAIQGVAQSNPDDRVDWYELTPEELEFEMAYQEALMEAYLKEKASHPQPETAPKGFSELVADTRGLSQSLILMSDRDESRSGNSSENSVRMRATPYSYSSSKDPTADGDEVMQFEMTPQDMHIAPGRIAKSSDIRRLGRGVPAQSSTAQAGEQGRPAIITGMPTVAAQTGGNVNAPSRFGSVDLQKGQLDGQPAPSTPLYGTVVGQGGGGLVADNGGQGYIDFNHRDLGGMPASPQAAGFRLNVPHAQSSGLSGLGGMSGRFLAAHDSGASSLGLNDPIMSNAMNPQTELLLQALRRGDVLGRQPIVSGFVIGYRDVPGTEAYAPIVENPFVSPLDEPLSTFGLDVDTAAFANVRRFLLDEHRWPPPDAVRIEELLNAFSYADPQPADEHPLHVTLEAAACPWQPAHRLVRIGVKGREMDLADRPPTSLVFLIDTSGSMRDDNKLSLVKQSLRLLVEEMTENDRIALVTYSSEAGLVLGSTSGQHREAIMAVIDSLEASGSTNGEAGLMLAYDVASQHFITNGTNRVILCTDGDFNVGESADAPLVRMISEKRDTGVFLSICGFGTGNLKDDKLEQIADHGNGQYHYIDGFREARRVFLEDLAGMLYTIAKDVKLQVEFNPAQVGAYRLLGYENRALAAEDFNNDRIDAGDLGAGHSVTALYEIVPPGEVSAKPAGETPGVDPLKYQGSGNREQGTGNSDDKRQEAGGQSLAATQRGALPAANHSQPSTLNSQLSGDLLTVKLRYKQPDSDESIKLEFPLVDEVDSASPSADLEWAAAVASFGMLLRNSAYRGESSVEGVLELARGAKRDDPSGDRQEFIELVLEARHLLRKATGTTSPPPPELSSLEARRKASLGGRYQELLDKFDQAADFDRYGSFHDAGRKDASPDGKHPAGYWVYVSPHWYIWGETTPVSKVPPAPER